jgi:hypothetical protein
MFALGSVRLMGSLRDCLPESWECDLALKTSKVQHFYDSEYRAS